MSMTIQSSVKDKIFATSSKTSKAENTPAEMLHDLYQQMEKRADDGCTLWIKLYSKYEYEICYHLAQSEAFKQENVLAEILHGLDQQMERKGDESFYHSSIRRAPFEALYDYGRKCRSHVLWLEIGESSLTGLELVQETTDKVVLVKEKPRVARDCQKSYADNRRKPLKFEEIVISLEVLVENGYLRFLVDFSTPLNVFLWFWLKFLFDELRGRVVNDIVTQLKVFDKFPRLRVRFRLDEIQSMVLNSRGNVRTI
ncbi:hypothetical protein Tco_0017662 [Tanacetum coccineum]